MRNKISRAKTG